MTHLGLFEGIGGFSLAAHWMGWRTAAWVEINKDCQKVLRHKFSEAEGHDDIKTFNGDRFRGSIDILTGGFPCQTFSLAGKGALDLSLWKEMLRVIRESEPRIVVAENVFGILARKNGYALEVVCSDLEAEGYEVLPPLIIPACSQGAPHRRDRVWIIAHSNLPGHGRRRPGEDRQTPSPLPCKENKWQWIRYESFRNGTAWTIADPHTPRLPRRLQPRQCCFQKAIEPFGGRESDRAYPKSNWSLFPSESPVSTRDDGLPGRLDRSDARLRIRSIKAGGNAIVPQVAFEIFKAIEAADLSKLSV